MRRNRILLEMVAQGFSPDQLATEYGVEERHVQLAARYASAYLKTAYTPVARAFDATKIAQP
jgi:uncharacterized protein (DUF433 family)